MKAKCIDNTNTTRITAGSTYNIIDTTPLFYYVIDNGGIKSGWNKSRFKVENPINLTKKQESVNCLFLNQFTRKQLRELAKQLGVKTGKDKWDTMSNLAESGKLASTLTIEIKE